MVADDDPVTRASLSRHLQNAGFQTITAADGEQAMKNMRDEVDVILLDLHMPKASGWDCLEVIHKTFPDSRVIVVTSSGHVSDAVEAMKRGASEYVTKPFDPDDLLVQVRLAVQTAKNSKEHRGLKEVVGRSLPTSDFASKSTVMRRLLENASRVAQLDSTVLITGESGTGKTTIARMIHQQGACGDGPFVAVNCASLPRDLIEAELFGHAKGAFTGAIGDRPGRVEIADGGTLFLDEIGDLPLELQPKLLTFLQDRIIQRIGSNKEMKVNVRLIAATHQDLSQMCDEKRFRLDLFYRLNVLSLEVPTVRERMPDIPAIAETILHRIADRRGTETPTLEDDALALMRSYHWPGNIREMENVLESATVFCNESIIGVDDLGIGAASSATADNENARPAGSLAGKTLAEIEKLAILETLESCGGNKALTARTLGISEKSIYNKIRRHGIAL